jgi:hypothetical protein
MTVAVMLPLSQAAAGAMTKEEATVRAVYASVVLGSRIQAVMASGGESDTAGLSISLTDFHQGPISELLDRVVSDEVTVASGDVLQCTPGTWNFQTTAFETKHIGTTVNVSSWVPATTAYGELGNHPQVLNVTFFRAFHELGWHPTTWVSFTVSVSAHGRERQYKAMFLWDVTAPDLSEHVRPIDYVLGPSLLMALMRSSLAEDIAALPARTPGVGPVKLLESVRASTGCMADSVTGLCCDPVTLQCGVKPRQNSPEREPVGRAGDGSSCVH